MAAMGETAGICPVCNGALDAWERCPTCPSRSVVFKQGSALAWLVPHEGDAEGEVLQLAPGSTVGSDAGCGVRLRGIAGRHLKVHTTADTFYVEDLGSAQGTRLGSRKLTANVRESVSDGDELTLGKLKVLFKCL